MPAIASADGPSRAAFLGRDGIVGGDEAVVRQAILVDHGEAEGADSDPVLARLWQRVASREQVVAVAQVPANWRGWLGRMLGGIDAYAFVFDPYVPEVVESRLSDDMASIAIDLENGLRHFRSGNVEEALWWWQFSYVSNWGNLAGAALNALLTVVAHDRFDTDFDANAEAVAVADEMLDGQVGLQP